MDTIAQLQRLSSDIPGSSITPISADDAAHILEEFPGIPESYLDLLTRVGAGTFGNVGFRLYGGPIEAGDVFDPITAQTLGQYLFLGDDYSGWMAAYDTGASPWQLRLFHHHELYPVAADDPADLASFVCRELSR